VAGTRALPAGLQKILRAVAVGAAGAVLALALWLPHGLDAFEARTWDMRARLLARRGKETSQVVTILLDQKSLDWASKVNQLGWPWPRSLYAMIADFCRLGGAKALVLDVLYTEETNEDPGQDQELARGIAENGHVIAAVNLSRVKGQGGAQKWPGDFQQPPVAVDGLDAWQPRNLSFPFALFPIPAVTRAARMLANTNLPPDRADGVYRSEPLFNTFDGRVMPSEPLAAWLVGNPQAGPLVVAPGTLTVGGRRVPIDADGRAILRYRGPTLTHTNYNAAEILNAAQQILEGTQPKPDPKELKDKYVFFGFTAPGLFDLKPTPMGSAYPGVEVMATMLDNLLSGDFLRQMPTAATIVLLVLLCIGAGLAVSAVSGAGRSALIYVAFIPLAPALGVAAYALGWWLQVVVLELGTLLTLVGGSILNYATEGQQKRYIKGAFKQYLSPTIIEELIAHPERLKLGGEKRELSIFFSDLQGFTTISESLTPEDLTKLLNEYLTAMTDIIQEEGGTIDKYEGDAIIAFWNAPLDQPDHAVRAVRAALRCQAKLLEMRPSLKARWGKELHKRIGINSGNAVVGNFGSHSKFNYTMLGDAVNLASRLEGVNKQFRTFTMISSMVMEKLGGAFPARELSRIAVVGRKEPVTVFEPMMAEEYAFRREALTVFDTGLRAYYSGDFAEAGRIFDSLVSVDPAAASYAEKVRKLRANPPEGEWNGVWVMTEK
jgi:adenylate cyclase